MGNKKPMSDRKIALIKLSVYFIGFLLLMVLANANQKNMPPTNLNNDKQSSSSSSSSSNQEKTSLSLIEMKAIITNKPYTFATKITINEEKYMLMGMHETSEIKGIYSKNEALGVSFIIKDGNIYENTNEGFTVNNELFSDIDLNYIDARNILKLIEASEPLVKEVDSKKEYIYSINNKEITIKADKKIELIQVVYVDKEILHTYEIVIH